MGSALKICMSRSELIELMAGAVDWSVLRQAEAQKLHRKIVEAANIVILAAPQLLKGRVRG